MFFFVFYICTVRRRMEFVLHHWHFNDIFPKKAKYSTTSTCTCNGKKWKSYCKVFTKNSNLFSILIDTFCWEFQFLLSQKKIVWNYFMRIMKGTQRILSKLHTFTKLFLKGIIYYPHTMYLVNHWFVYETAAWDFCSWNHIWNATSFPLIS